MTALKRILIHVASLGSARLLLDLAGRFKREGLDVMVSTDVESPSLMAEASHVASKLFRFGAFQPWRGPVVPTDLARSYKGDSKMMELAKHNIRQVNAASSLLEKTDPDVLVVGEDGISGNYWLLNTAQKQGIATLNCPFSMGSVRDLDDDLAAKQRRGDLIDSSEGWGPIVRERYPHWVKTGAFAGALMLPPEFIITMEDQGITVPHPWIIHGSMADVLAVESEKMLRHYRDEGVPEEKLRLTGTTYCDILHESLTGDESWRRAFDDSRPIEPGSRSMLVSWPPSYDSKRGHLSEFSDYRKMTTQILNYLRGVHGMKCVVCPHPAVDPETVALIEGLGLPVDREHVIRLIPQFDLYLTCFSSSIRYAIACAKPVVNYDLYQFALKVYEDERAVITMHRFADFKQTVESLLDDERYAVAARLQKESSADWGILDGRNFERIKALLPSSGRERTGFLKRIFGDRRPPADRPW